MKCPELVFMCEHMEKVSFFFYCIPFMNHKLIFVILLLSLLLYTHAQDESDEDTTSSSSPSSSSTQPASASETNSADESTQPVNEELNNSKNLFSTPPRISDITDMVQVKLYCEIDKQFCGKVEHSLKLAAASFSQVINLKNKIV